MSAPATSAASTTRPVAALPALPNDANISPQLLARLQAVVERIATLDGQRGDALDAALTKRDLVDVGLLKVGRGGSIDGLNDNTFSGGWTNIPYLDAMPTPAPPTFETGIGVNFLFWILPNARGVGATQIFRRTNNTDGTIIAAPVGAMYADLPVEFGVTYYYKIRFVSEKGTPGDWSSEVRVVSEVDPAFVIETLQGQINESELATALRDKVKTGGTFDTAIKKEATTRKTATDALASQINTVSANVGKVSAAVTAETTARINADGSVIAKYTSTATAGGKTAGFTYGSDGKISEFYIMADRFAVLSADADDNPTTPFIVEGDKTYIQSAVIKDASISGAKIAKATITAANIADLNVMEVAVGGRINSSNYNPTTKTGWAINQDGSAFFGGNTTFGGKLEIGKVGQANGVVINNNGIYVYDSAGKLRVAIGKL
jgi:hypothetical protein